MTKQNVADIFTTAMEGDIDYWCNITKYHWIKLETTNEPDLEGFFATITSPAGDWSGDKTINSEVIVRGMKLIASGEVSVRPDIYRQVVEALAGNVYAVGQIDADGADTIVQAGLFGAIVYG